MDAAEREMLRMYCYRSLSPTCRAILEGAIKVKPEDDDRSKKTEKEKSNE